MRVLLWRAAIGLAGVAVLAALVWWFGPWASVLEPAWTRAAVAAGPVLVWTAVIGPALLRQSQRERALAAVIPGAAEDAAAAGAQAAQAIGRSRAAGGVYALPWYVIIGPPGAGKTTALLNAGLVLPRGDAPIAGVGGTRHCDWWFTDTGVMIDTAGRYTTQDSDAAIDRSGWHAFLGHLHRARPRQPLNGVIVAISATEITGVPPGLRTAHAQAIRSRMAELDEQLRARLPVYLLLTKADLIAGFSEFFDDLDPDRRRQVWGTTFPWRAAPDLAQAWAGLVTRLNDRLLPRLSAERGPERRALIAGFPAQVASLLPPLDQFVAEAFGGNPLLRGVYLTSGTQEGTPVDRLTGLLARTFGVDQQRAPALRPQSGRSYFLHGLLAGVLPGEAMLVTTGPERVRRHRALRLAGLAGVVMVTCAGCGGIWWARTQAVAQQATARSALDGLMAEAGRRPLDPVADTDLAGLLPLLDRARDLPFAGTVRDGRLGQARILGAGSRSAYRQVLERVLLPRLLRRLEQQMAGGLDRPDFIYEATRVYLMLGGAGPLDPTLLREWMRQDWAGLYPGPGLDLIRDRLGGHLDALPAIPLPPVTLDGALVDQAREAIGRVSPPARVYARIRAAVMGLPKWQPRQALGALGAPLFRRTSGRGLEDGVPGFLTAAGFRDAVRPAIPDAFRAVAAESWVTGRVLPDDPAALTSIGQGVTALYAAEFIRVWDDMLDDLQIVPLKSVSQAAQDVFILAARESPMRKLLQAVVAQVDVPIPAIEAHFLPLRAFVGDGPGAPIDQAMRTLTDPQQFLSKLAGSVTPPEGGPDPAAALRAELPHWPAPFVRWMRSIADGVTALRTGRGVGRE